MAFFGLRRIPRSGEVAGENPWLATDDSVIREPSAPLAPTALPYLEPHPAIPAPPADRQLPIRQANADEANAALTWLSAHGGGGESTLARLVPDTRAGGHAWPIAPDGRPPLAVALVARTSFAGLTAAQHALAHWASGQLPVELRGLVLMADAPGKPPRDLRDFALILRRALGGLPCCSVPWHRAWRVGPGDPADVRRHLKHLIPSPQEAR